MLDINQRIFADSGKYRTSSRQWCVHDFGVLPALKPRRLLADTQP